MKHLKSLGSIVFIAIVACACLLSCESDSSLSRSEETTAEAVQSFKNAFDRAENPAFFDKSMDSKVTSIQSAKALVKEAREVIYSTGVSEEVCNKMYKTDDEIIMAAFDICVQETNKQLNK